jgi:early secretory antigenic target protein ESAT-6
MAGDGVLLVNFGALQQASADINKGVSTLQSQLDQLERDAAPLVSEWDGEAKEAYQIRQQKWRQASAELTQILQNIKGAVDRAAEDHREAGDPALPVGAVEYERRTVGSTLGGCTGRFRLVRCCVFSVPRSVTGPECPGRYDRCLNDRA